MSFVSKFASNMKCIFPNIDTPMKKFMCVTAGGTVGIGLYGFFTKAVVSVSLVPTSRVNENSGIITKSTYGKILDATVLHSMEMFERTKYDPVSIFVVSGVTYLQYKLLRYYTSDSIINFKPFETKECCAVIRKSMGRVFFGAIGVTTSAALVMFIGLNVFAIFTTIKSNEMIPFNKIGTLYYKDYIKPIFE